MDLKIRDAKKSDSGVYRCTGSNEAGEVSEEISINVRCKYTNSFIQVCTHSFIQVCTHSFIQVYRE